jgi:hypothetical protein
MSRLKKIANNVSPAIHKEVEKQMTNPNADSSKVLLSKEEFVIAKRLLADLPIVPTNERLYELVQEIQLGQFDDISSIAEAEDHWSEWKQRTLDILRSKNIVLSKK